MPDIGTDARDQLLLHQFLTGLPLRSVSSSGLRMMQSRLMKQSRLINEAVERARLLMAIERDQTQSAAVVEAGEVQELRLLF